MPGPKYLCRKKEQCFLREERASCQSRSLLRCQMMMPESSSQARYPPLGPGSGLGVAILQVPVEDWQSGTEVLCPGWKPSEGQVRCRSQMDPRRTLLWCIRSRQGVGRLRCAEALVTLEDCAGPFLEAADHHRRCPSMKILVGRTSGNDTIFYPTFHGKMKKGSTGSRFVFTGKYFGRSFLGCIEADR